MKKSPRTTIACRLAEKPEQTAKEVEESQMEITNILKCLISFAKDLSILLIFSKMRRKKIQISKIKIEKGKITTSTKEIQGIIREYFQNLYYNKLENLEKMKKLLHTYDHPKQNQEDIPPKRIYNT
jgi:Fe-S oxidoreductase